MKKHMFLFVSLFAVLCSFSVQAQNDETVWERGRDDAIAYRNILSNLAERVVILQDHKKFEEFFLSRCSSDLACDYNSLSEHDRKKVLREFARDHAQELLPFLHAVLQKRSILNYWVQQQYRL